MRVYIAAPLFTQAQRRWNREFARALAAAWPETTGLDKELELVLPQDFAVPEGADEDGRFRALFDDCLAQLDRVDAVVSVLEGADADSGVAFEHGYAYAKGKPIVGVRSDLRDNRIHGLNIMLDKTCRRYVYRRAFDDRIAPLAQAVAQALRAATGA